MNRADREVTFQSAGRGRCNVLFDGKLWGAILRESGGVGLSPVWWVSSTYCASHHYARTLRECQDWVRANRRSL